MDTMEENNDVIAVADMRVPGKRIRVRPRGSHYYVVLKGVQLLQVV